MNKLEVDYSSLSANDKKIWVITEIERQRAKNKFATRHNTQDPKIHKALNDSFDLGLSPELVGAFKNLSCRLSPENLHCDGEISRAQAKARYNQIKREWKALEKNAGRKVSESEFPY